MLTETIKKYLEELDFEPKLEINITPLYINRSVILSDKNGTNYIKNPRLYIVNSCAPSPVMRSYNLHARMLASRAVRRRAQTIVPDIDLFGSEILVSDTFVKKIELLADSVWDEFELDAEIMARIGGYLYLRKAPIEDCQNILTMSASSILEKYGESFIVECMDI